jgi:hypothetical protein
LLALLEQFAQRVQHHSEEIALLKDEINILKGEKKRPVFKGSKLDQLTNIATIPEKIPKKRPGSAKRKKTQALLINEDKIIKPDGFIPAGSHFKGYRDFVVQDLIIKPHTIRYRLEHWVTPDHQSLTGELPPSLNNQHFGPHLVSYILYQHHQCNTTQPLLLEQLREFDIDISSGQVNQLLLHGKEHFHAEKDAVLQAGLNASAYITVDDNGARHQGSNGYVTQIGNDFFAWFQSTGSKSRINFLELLRAGNTDYSLTDAALFYMKQQQLPAQSLAQLELCRGRTLTNAADWTTLLDSLSITKQRHRRMATEGALLGSVLKHGLCHDLVIVSDDADQFNILLHALCWIHTERLIHKMLPLNETHRQEITGIREQIWCLYADLKRYQ